MKQKLESLLLKFLESPYFIKRCMGPDVYEKECIDQSCLWGYKPQSPHGVLTPDLPPSKCGLDDIESISD